MDVLMVAHRIEALLRTVTSMQEDFSNSVQIEPYGTIMSVLRERLPRGARQFAIWYGGISEKNLKELDQENYNFEVLIKDLKKIIEKGE